MYRITQCLSVGPFASPERAVNLCAAGVTHVLNVSDGPSTISSADGFAEVAWVPLEDSRGSRSQPRANCSTRSTGLCLSPAHTSTFTAWPGNCAPTALWLYLVALGVPPEDARNWIEARSRDAVAGHHRMVDHEHVLLAQKHGLANFFPHPRPDIIVPFPLADEE